MYKVAAVKDDVLDRFDLTQQIKNAHCVEFDSVIISADDICGEIENAKPDVFVMSLKTASENRQTLLLLKSDTRCLIVYDSFETTLADDRLFPKNWTMFDVQSEKDICVIISGIVNKMKSSRAKENFEKMVIHEADRVKPIIREQFFKEYIFGFGNTEEIFNIYCKTFNVSPNQKVQMLLFHPEQEFDFEDYFFLKNIIESHLGMDNLIMSTILKDHILVVSGLTGGDRITAILKELEKVFGKYYSHKITTVYSGVHNIEDTPKMYEKLKESLEYCFYTDNAAFVCAEDTDAAGNGVELEPNYSAIERAGKSSDSEKMRVFLHDFFRDLERAKPKPAVAKTYCLELYVCIIRCCEVEKIDKYMKGIMELQEFKTLSDVKEYIMNIANEIVQANSPKHLKHYSSLINNTMDIIENNIGNEHLSLRWIANNILYTNVDYLGKLFKKEIGENFSHFVMEKRMELAKKLIIEGKKDRIYEVAEKVGYGSNSQYFSQVFKKYTGVSPLEYKEYVRNSYVG